MKNVFRFEVGEVLNKVTQKDTGVSVPSLDFSEDIYSLTTQSYFEA